MADEKAGGSAWWRYFPEHYLWSQVFCGLLNLGPLGGPVPWELDQAGKRLRRRVGDPEAWYEEWEREADAAQALAEGEEARGHGRTAARAWLRSSLYRCVSERFIHPDDPRKAASYQQAVRDCERGYRGLIEGFERVDVPSPDGPLPAYWIPPLGAQGGSRRAPAVAYFDGLDGSKEFTVLWAGLALRERGIGTLCIDGPGQGEALRLRKIPSRPDYEVPGAAAYDYLAGRPEVDPSRVGVMAMSMGGYYAPRIAAFEHRYAACVAWGAHFDYHEVWVHRRKVLEGGGTVASSSIWQLPWVFGCPDMDRAMEKCKAYTLAGVAEEIRMPILILHGQDDAIVPVRMAHRLHEACGSKEKELRIFRAEDGGSQHCVFDNLQLASGFVADWWMDRFSGRR